MSEAPSVRDWDAEVYHRTSTAQFRNGMEVLERLPLQGDETVLDAGCGSGRLTAVIAERLPHGRVIACDGSPAMVEQTRSLLPDIEVFEVDLAQLELDEPVDAIFSNAVIHWIPDHESLFRRFHAALRPGGRLVTQAGGAGNLVLLDEVLDQVMASPPYAEHFAGWDGPWNYPTPEAETAALEAAGFEGIHCELVTRTLDPKDGTAWLRSTALGAHTERLPEDLREPFVQAIAQGLPDPLVLEDYIRLNVTAHKPAA